VIYLDTSWLVKLYVDEADAERVRRASDAAATVFVSDLSYVEFHGALARRRREGSLSSGTATGLRARFRREWPSRNRIAVSRDVIGGAADLVSKHALRSLDALHLASALAVAAGAVERLRFGAGDDRLVAAAAAEGLVPLTI
jgi:predicted nucleic acid-binding protein